MNNSQVLGNYLSLASSIGKNKSTLFVFIVKRVKNRVQGWKSKLLNQDGKEIFIKPIITAIPTYAMTCFLTPKICCNRINANQRKFLWGSDETKKKNN